MIFSNRQDAGKQLAAKLIKYKDRQDVKLLALPRGGVPVAYEVAKELNLPLDVLLVRKIGIPDHEETAMGAISIDDIAILNEELIQQLNISWQDIDRIIAKERKELRRRNDLYRKDKKPLDVKDKTVIVIDDGIAMGSTMYAAIAFLKKQQVRYITIAVPVSSKSAYQELRPEVDELICLHIPNNFYAVGNWYKTFSQISDKEVQNLLHICY